MNKLIAVTLGLALSASAFAQDLRTVEYDSIDSCLGTPIEHEVFTPKSRGDSRVLDSIDFQTVLAFEAIDECTDREVSCDPDNGGGPTKLLLSACDRLRLIFSKGRDVLQETDSIIRYKAGPVEIVCSKSEGGHGGNDNCSGFPDNASSDRAQLIHGGALEHDTNLENGDNAPRL